MKLTLKFHGTREALEQTLGYEGIRGDWGPEPNGVYRMRLRDGTSLHWSPTTGSLWCDGSAKAPTRLEGRATMALHWLETHDTWPPETWSD